MIAGISLISKPLWVDFINSTLNTQNENNPEFQFAIIGKYDWLLGLIIIVLSLIWNTRNRMIDLKYEKDSQPEYKNAEKVTFNSIEEVFKSIYPILKDNEYIFKTVGPNSGAEETDELRTDLTMWYKYRSEAIIPNNQKIKEILDNNESLFDTKTRALSKTMILHIDAFEEHIKNPSFDYSEYVFPLQFQEFVEDTCFNHTKESRTFKKRFNWINKKINRIKADEWYFIGSALFNSEKANDLDLVLQLNSQSEKTDYNKVKAISLDFKLKFGINLHTTIFSPDENEEYSLFLSTNKYKIKGNG